MPNLNYSFRGSHYSGAVEQIGQSFVFKYPCNDTNECDPYQVSFSEGFFNFELWGGDGIPSGKGSYAKGIIHFSSQTVLYFHVGAGPGKYNSVPPYAVTPAGNDGGGATDVRTSYLPYYEFESLKSRIIVAGGAGSCEFYFGYGMNGGSLIGETGITSTDSQGNPLNWAATGGSQTSGGTGNNTRVVPGYFGIAGYLNHTIDWGSSGGGGGYYGGASIDNAGASGGGSSFISGHPGCQSVKAESTSSDIIHNDNSYHYSGYVFMSTVLYGGQYSNIYPSRPSSKHGSIRITPLFLQYCRASCRYHVYFFLLIPFVNILLLTS